MVTHQVNITALSGGIFPQSGSAVVVQSKDNQLSILGTILEQSLQRLEQAE